ncbi:MAG: hypothetical protein L7U60_06650 [Bacteroidia bacterium]|jgi:nucleoid DNA-binding protein|nr:hypothetical protein [Bacteroidia bacterium]
MLNPAFHTAIESVLLKESFVCIPGLGSFLLKDAEASINPYSGEIKPSHSVIAFNAQIADNDGQLVHRISKELSLSYKEALAFLENEVQVLRNKIESKKYASFFPFGNFFLNKSGKIFFVPRQQYNLHLPNYGLKNLKWESNQTKSQNEWVKPQVVSETTSTEDATVVSLSDEHIEKNESTHRLNPIWNIAASFAIISVSLLTIGIAALSWVGIYNESQQLAGMSNVPSVNKSSETAPKQQYVWVNGKLLNLNEKAETTQNTQKKTEVSTTETFDENQTHTTKSVDLTFDAKPTIMDVKSYLEDLLHNQKGQYFLVGGSYLTQKAAELECTQWNNKGLNATILKPASSSFKKIVLGRFSTKQDVQEFIVNIKGIPEGSLSITRWNIGK